MKVQARGLLSSTLIAPRRRRQRTDRQPEGEKRVKGEGAGVGGGGRRGSGGRKTVCEKVWVRCGPRSTDSSPELCPGRSRKIYNADVFSRRLALGLLRLRRPFFVHSGEYKGGGEDETAGEEGATD